MLISEIDDGYVGIVNTWKPKSLKVINSKQNSLLTEIDGKSTILQISKKVGIDIEEIFNFCKMLEPNDLVRFDQSFSSIERPEEPSTLSLWIHTTNKCNLTCNYCYIPTLNTTGGMDVKVQSELLIKLEQTIISRKLRMVKLRLAGGEPLIKFKEWKVFIETAFVIAKRNDCKIKVSFLTNLTVLTQEIISFSKQYQIGFGVSIDGLKENHDDIRKFRNNKGSFDILLNNLNLLIENGISVSTSTVVNNYNFFGLPELTRFLIDKDIPFRYSIVRGEYVDRLSISNYLMECYKLMERSIEDGWRFSNHTLCDLKPSELGFQTCGAGFSGGAVYVDGGIYYCHVQFGGQKQEVDNIFNTSIDLLSMIEKGNEYEGSKSDDCQSCNYKHVCTSGCPMFRENGKDPNCGIYHQFIPIIYKLQAKERFLEIKKNYNVRI
ncbi:radical SAM protein [Pedobacter aquatilis]|uniref:radical SAM/SPASM domain-containing protein n=1 Tax=Pedobacter aquatilis TaxID=351343 RepID=UPI0025B32D98|nr:radical SAM protein [Pedobacter aquatilis]MDN3588069.1 radical SAM protein [Pedobacter aquatilis]